MSVATVLAIALAGCVPTPPTTSGQVALEGAALGLAGTPAPRIPDDWWRSLGDPQLDMLMAAGLAGSPSIAAATARLKSAEALLGEARAERDPQIAADGQLVRQRLSGRYTIPPPYAGSSRWIGTAQATLDWNLDLFGRQRAAIAEARASADAAALDTGAARLMIEGAIAQAYVDLDRTYRLADVARAFVEGREESVGIVQARIRNGLASQFDAHAAETLLAEARQALLRAESSRAVAENLLATLAGRGPDFARTIVRPMLHLEGIMPLPDVLPADLLGRRPDLLAAQARIDAALAGQRAARADFYPNIDLKALVGIASIGLSSLVSTDAATYGGGPAFRLPIFDGGRLRARYAGAGARLDRAIADYNDAVLRAVREAADALALIRAGDADLAEQAQILSGLEATVRLDQARVRSGLGSRLDVLNAGTRLLSARQAEAELRAAAAIRRVQLVLALGGGFAPPPSSDIAAAKGPE